MALPPEMLGFERAKAGPKDTEEAYAMEKVRLTMLISGTLGLLVVLLVATVLFFFDVTLESRADLGRLRLREKKAAHQLVQTELHLWNEYLVTIHESFEAKTIYEQLKKKNGELREALTDDIHKGALQLSISEPKAELLIERVLKLTALHKEDTLSLVRRLVDHLVEDARKAATAEHMLQPEMEKGIDETAADDELFAAQDLEGETEERGGKYNEAVESSERELVQMLTAFFKKVEERRPLVEGAQWAGKERGLYKELSHLHEEIQTDDAERQAAAVEKLHSFAEQFKDAGLEIPKPGNEDHWLRVVLAAFDVDLPALDAARQMFESKALRPTAVLSEISQLSREKKIPAEWLMVMVQQSSAAGSH